MKEKDKNQIELEKRNKMIEGLNKEKNIIEEKMSGLNEKYQKIEYKYEDKKEGISIDFLLGFQENSWKLWIGKIGSCSYDDDPYCDLETDKFAEAIVKSLDKTEEFIKEVESDPQNWVQYYKNI